MKRLHNLDQLFCNMIRRYGKKNINTVCSRLITYATCHRVEKWKKSNDTTVCHYWNSSGRRVAQTNCDSYHWFSIKTSIIVLNYSFKRLATGLIQAIQHNLPLPAAATFITSRSTIRRFQSDDECIPFENSLNWLCRVLVTRLNNGWQLFVCIVLSAQRDSSAKINYQWHQSNA